MSPTTWRDTLYAAFPQLVIGQGTVGAVWYSGASCCSGSQTIFYAQRNSPSSFTTPAALVTLNGEVGDCFTAFVIPSNGNIAVGWCGGANSSGAGLWFLGSVTGAQPIQIASGPTFATPQLAADPSGNVYACWTVYLGSQKWGTEFSKSSGPSGPFSAPQQLFAGQNVGIDQMLVDSSGNINLLLGASGGGVDPAGVGYATFTLLFSRSTDQGNTFSAPLSIAGDSCGLCAPGFQTEIAVDSNGVVDLALGPAEDSVEVFSSFSRSNPQLTAFSTPVSIPVSPQSDRGSTQITTDATNNVWISWPGQGVFIIEGSAPPDFIIGAAPPVERVLPGGAASFSVALIPSGGFTDPVNLTCTNLPPGAECAFNPSSVTPSGSGSQAMLTITTPPTLAQGGYSAVVSAAGGDITRTITLQVAVGGISSSMSPSSAIIAAGSSANFAVALNSAERLRRATDARLVPACPRAWLAASIRRSWASPRTAPPPRR